MDTCIGFFLANENDNNNNNRLIICLYSGIAKYDVFFFPFLQSEETIVENNNSPEHHKSELPLIVQSIYKSTTSNSHTT